MQYHNPEHRSQNSTIWELEPPPTIQKDLNETQQPNPLQTLMNDNNLEDDDKLRLEKRVGAHNTERERG